jgi:hypothetical protein
MDPLVPMFPVAHCQLQAWFRPAPQPLPLGVSRPWGEGLRHAGSKGVVASNGVNGKNGTIYSYWYLLPIARRGGPRRPMHPR